MDKKLTFPGGEPTLNWDDMDRDETANRLALFGIMKAFNIGTNENFIISGCDATLDPGVDVDVTAGYIFLNGEILQVDAQTVVDGGTADLYTYNKAVTYDVNGTKTFNDTISRQTWQKNRGVVTASSSPVLATELDVVNGDRLVDKIVQYVSSERVLTKVIDIGDWDMDTTGVVNVAHGLTLSKIIDISVYIINDIGDVLAPLNLLNSSTYDGEGRFLADSTNVVLTRKLSGAFDGTEYDSTSYNRGHVTIEYLP